MAEHDGHRAGHDSLDDMEVGVAEPDRGGLHPNLVRQKKGRRIDLLDSPAAMGLIQYCCAHLPFLRIET